MEATRLPTYTTQKTVFFMSPYNQHFCYCSTKERPVINSIQAPSYKLAKYLNEKLQNMLNLPNTYNIKNSKEIAQELQHPDQRRSQNRFAGH
jgi:hypothetical protein